MSCTAYLLHDGSLHKQANMTVDSVLVTQHEQSVLPPHDLLPLINVIAVSFMSAIFEY